MCNDIDKMMIELRIRWEIVELASVNDEWNCRNHTDEGLGGRLSFYGKTPLEAIQRAYNYEFHGTVSLTIYSEE